MLPRVLPQFATVCIVLLTSQIFLFGMLKRRFLSHNLHFSLFYLTVFTHFFMYTISGELHEMVPSTL